MLVIKMITMNNLKKTLGILGIGTKYFCLAYCTLEYIGDVVMCVGPSMKPTILDNDVVLTEHISTRWGRLTLGNIVIAKNPSDPKEKICKRIIGLPGDKVHHGLESCTVPKGHVWLEGDNTSNSNDSRTFGPVPQGLLRSRVLFKIWPITNFEKL